MLQHHRRLRELRRRARALVLHRQISADQELLGRHQRLAHGRDRLGPGRAVAQALGPGRLRGGGEPRGSPPVSGLSIRARSRRARSAGSGSGRRSAARERQRVIARPERLWRPVPLARSRRHLAQRRCRAVPQRGAHGRGRSARPGPAPARHRSRPDALRQRRPQLDARGRRADHRRGLRAGLPAGWCRRDRRGAGRHLPPRRRPVDRGRRAGRRARRRARRRSAPRRSASIWPAGSGCSSSDDGGRSFARAGGLPGSRRGHRPRGRDRARRRWSSRWSTARCWRAPTAAGSWQPRSPQPASGPLETVALDPAAPGRLWAAGAGRI